MRYSKNFNRDWFFYLTNWRIFYFSGNEFDYPSKYKNVVYDKNGVSAKRAFFDWESKGKITPTRQPQLLKVILKAKASVNLHIKMWAEDRAKGILPKIIFNEMSREMCLLDWIVDAVEQQKCKYY